MNRPAALVFASSVLVAAPFFACEDPSTGAYDAGPFDAAFIPPDGTSPDSSLPPGDAAQEAAPIATATVLVTDVGVPVAGVTVVFQDAAGAVVGTAVTGADGKASAVVVAGSQLTVVTGSQGSRRLLTYLGVKPGDVLNVALPSARAVSIALAINNPGTTLTTIVEAGNPTCSATPPVNGGPTVLALRLSCITGPVFPVLATSIGGTLAPIRNYSFLKGVAPAASGVTTVSGMSAWAAGTAYDLNVTNAPNLPGASAHLGQIVNNQAAAFPAETALVLAAGAGTANFKVAPGYADAYQGEVQFIDFAIPSRQRVVSFAKRVPAGGAAEALDLTPGLLPQLTSLAVTGTTRASVTWSAASSLAVADSGVVSVTWTQPTDGGTETIAWTFIVPPDALTLTLPELPGPLAAFAPDASSVFAVPAAAFFESDLIPGYDAVRAQAAAFGLATVPMPALTPLASPALPAAGTLRITALSLGG
jgi:hypothetical protein